MPGTTLSRLLLLAAGLTLSSAARADRNGTHGMLLFGMEGTYASHLPMFRAPHDAQVLLELASDDTGCKARSPDGIYTIEPEVFDLDRLAPDAKAPLTTFVAKLYQGHFERDGHVLMPECRFRILKVLHFAWLDAQAQDGPINDYLVVGQGSERFLVRPIGGAPDMDRILRWTGFQKPPTTPLIDQVQAMRDGQLQPLYEEIADLQ